MTILSEDVDWQDVLAYEAFGEVIVSTAPPPVREQDRPSDHKAGEWTEADSVRTAAWISERYEIDLGVQTIEQAVVSAARRRTIHPVRDYFRSLTWDGTQRLPTLFTRYFGTPPSDYASAIGIRFFISAVARIEDPGCKADNLIVLEGKQGIGKSTAVKLLAVTPDWFSETGIVLGDKDSYQNLRGKWLYELAELASIRSARDVERYKAFLSTTIDSYRPSFGRRRADFPRQTVFIGTTNDTEYLNDRSGNRRFWPIHCTNIDLEGLKRDCDQLWAEAVTRYECHEAWHVDSAELARLCDEQQSEREQVDPWLQLVEAWLLDPTVPDPSLDAKTRLDLSRGVTTTEVLLGAIEMRKSDIDRTSETRAGQILRQLGFDPRQVRESGERVRRYVVPVAAE
jgi:putative DNA primase/helicase